MMKYYFYILLMFFPVLFYSQELTFSKGSSVKTREINTELKSVLDKQNISALNQYYQANSKKINDAVTSEKFTHENGLEGKRMKPAIHYVVDNYLNGIFKNTDVLNWYLKNNTDINTDFQGKNIVYRLLDAIATKPSNQTSKEIECIKLIFDSGKFKINENYKSFLSPFPYLLRTHFKYLNQKYNANYIDSDFIIYLIDKGAALETYDQDGNNLMALALTKNDNNLIEYLLSKNVNLTKSNQSGKDPLYFAIKNYNEQIVSQIISELNNKITPSYLHLIEVTDLDIYKSEPVKNQILEACYPNIKDVSDLIIFAKIFYKDKKKILNPIPIKLTSEAIPAFVAIFKQDELSKAESSLIEGLKVDYINASKNYLETIERLKVFPMFQIKSYDVSDYKMAEANNLDLLKKETQSIPEKFGQLRTTLNQEFLAIQERTNKIKNDALFDAQFRQDIKIVDNTYYVQAGDGATFWEAASIDKNNKFKKYKLVLVSFIRNNSKTQTYNVELDVSFGYLSKTLTFGLFQDATEEKAYEKSFLNIAPGETKPVVTVCNFTESYINMGIVAGKREINTRKPFEITYYRPYSGNLTSEYANYQQNLLNQLAANGKLKTKTGYDDVIRNNCNNCIVDEKKSKGPKWELEGLIWKELVERDGVIVMKNGDFYKFRRFFENGKPYYQFIKSSFLLFEDLSGKYQDFEKMLSDLMKICKEKKCNY